MPLATTLPCGARTILDTTSVPRPPGGLRACSENRTPAIALPRRRASTATKQACISIQRAGRAGIEPASSHGSKPRRPCRQSNRPPEPFPRVELGRLPLQGATGRRSEGHHVRSAGFEPASTWPSTKPVYLFAARARGAATRCRPGPPALRGQGRSRARRRSYRGWNRTSVAKVQSLDGMPTTHPVSSRRGGSRTLNRSGLGRSALPDWTYSPVRREGFEPPSV